MENIKGKARLKMSSIDLAKNYSSSGIRRNASFGGGAMFVRREAFEKASGINPNIFLYHEDQIM